MFNTKNKTDMNSSASGATGATLISAGTTLKGDISSNSDLRIDGTVNGNISCTSKIIIGATGVVEGDISCNQADIAGKVSGSVRSKELLQLRGQSVVSGNLFTGKLQVEPTASFNGQVHMGANIVEMNNNNEQAAAAK